MREEFHLVFIWIFSVSDIQHFHLPWGGLKTGLGRDKSRGTPIDLTIVGHHSRDISTVSQYVSLVM